jgi:hypothetical protein
MAIKTALLVIGILVVLVFVFSRFKQNKPKIIGGIMIILLLTMFLSFNFAMKNQDIDFKSVSGIISAGKIYFSWMGYAFGNFKTITANAIKMDWKGNQTNSE